MDTLYVWLILITVMLIASHVTFGLLFEEGHSTSEYTTQYPTVMSALFALTAAGILYGSATLMSLTLTTTQLLELLATVVLAIAITTGLLVFIPKRPTSLVIAFLATGLVLTMIWHAVHHADLLVGVPLQTGMFALILYVSTVSLGTYVAHGSWTRSRWFLAAYLLPVVGTVASLWILAR